MSTVIERGGRWGRAGSTGRKVPLLSWRQLSLLNALIANLQVGLVDSTGGGQNSGWRIISLEFRTPTSTLPPPCKHSYDFSSAPSHLQPHQINMQSKWKSKFKTSLLAALPPTSNQTVVSAPKFLLCWQGTTHAAVNSEVKPTGSSVGILAVLFTTWP